MIANDMFRQGNSFSMNMGQFDNNKADLKTKIKVKELEILGIQIIMRGKDKKAKKQKESILKQIIKVQRLDITKSLEIFKIKDPKKAEYLFKTLNFESHLKEKFKKKVLETREFPDFKVSIYKEPDINGIMPRNTKEELIAGIKQPSSTELSNSLMQLGWRQSWNKSWQRPYFYNLKTGQNLWTLVEVQAVTRYTQMSRKQIL